MAKPCKESCSTIKVKLENNYFFLQKYCMTSNINGYSLFCEEHFKSIQVQRNDYRKSDTLQVLRELWVNLSYENKMSYKNKAAIIKVIHYSRLHNSFPYLQYF